MRIVLSVFFLILQTTIGLTQIGSAHTFEPDAIMRFGEVQMATDTVVLMYLLELGGDEYLKAMRNFDADKNLRLDEAELNQYLDDVMREVQSAQKIEIDHHPVKFNAIRKNSYNALGHHGASTIRTEISFLGHLPAEIAKDATIGFKYEDALWTQNPGWKQLRFMAQNGVRFHGHIPYQDIDVFDTVAMGDPTFMPSTNQLTLEVYIPRQTNPGHPTLSLEQLTQEHPLFNSGLVERPRQSNTMFWIIAGLIVVFGGGVIAKLKGWIE